MKPTQIKPRPRFRSTLLVVGVVGLYIGSFFYESHIELALVPRVHLAFSVGWGTVEFGDWYSFDAPPYVHASIESTGSVRSHDRRRKLGWHALIPKAVARVDGARSVTGACIAPLWPFVVVIIAFRWRALASLWNRPPGLCNKCGYDLRGNTSGVCPECGAAVDRSESAA